MTRNKLASVLALAILTLTASCGGDGGGDALELGGQWRMEVRLVSNDCGAPNGVTGDQQVTITQSGNTVRIQMQEGPDELVGTLSGNTLNVSSTVDQEDCAGTMRIAINATAGERRISGTMTADATPNPLGCQTGSSCRLSYSLVLTR